jgi:hypothetical protein
MITNRFYGQQPLFAATSLQFGRGKQTEDAFAEAIGQNDLNQARTLFKTLAQEAGSKKSCNVMAQTISKHLRLWSPKQLNNALNAIKEVVMITSDWGLDTFETMIYKVMGDLSKKHINMFGELELSRQERVHYNKRLKVLTSYLSCCD